MQVIYADTLFFLNLIINYVLLLVTAKICHSPARRLRLAIAAAFGAAYAVAVLYPSLAFLSSWMVKPAVGIAMALIAFGGQRALLRQVLVFLAVTAAFGGAVLASSLLFGGTGRLPSSVGLRILLPVFVAGYALLTLLLRRAARRPGGGGIVSLTVRNGTRTLQLRALKDTGNALVDPMTGRPVIVVGLADIAALFDVPVRRILEQLRHSSAVEVLEKLGCEGHGTRFRLVPYSAVGVTGGMLLTYRPDAVEIGGKVRRGVLLAVSPNSVSDSASYAALVGA
jgi:stage II sporulation protein GA (sporulation sigma-E factor processing peptidase)